MNYHGRLMNLQPDYSSPESHAVAYKRGYRDARHAAAEVANEADSEIERLREVVMSAYSCCCGECARKIEAVLPQQCAEHSGHVPPAAANADQPIWSSDDQRGTITSDGDMSIDPDCPTCGRPTKRHPGYVIGNHWLESAYERICAGEAEDDVLRDYDVVRVTDQASAAPEAK
jgi:hypothetical protein